jgi:hypothetical protein
MGVLHALADPDEQLDPLVCGPFTSIAVDIERLPRDVLHHEERPPVRCLAGVEGPRDRGMVHQRERLALAVEARDDLGRVEPALRDLQRDAPPQRRFLLGQPHLAHPALAQALHESVCADPGDRDAGFGSLACGMSARGCVGSSGPLVIGGLSLRAATGTPGV